MKKKQLDVNNVTDPKRRQDHMYSDILGQSGLDYKKASPKRATVHDDQGDVRRPGVTDAGAKGCKMSNLRSSLDNP